MTAVDLYLQLMKSCLMDIIHSDASPEDIAALERGGDYTTSAHTMIGRARLDNIQNCISHVVATGVPGDMIETGVWRGGASIFMRAVLKALGVTDRRVWVADSFCGLPTPTLEVDVEHHGTLGDPDLSVPLEVVRRNFDRYGLLDDQVVFLQGFFQDTLPKIGAQQFAVVRLDGDMYDSTMVALESLYPKLSVGGLLIVDDLALPQCRKAVLDYRDMHGITGGIRKIDWTGGFWCKTT